MDELLAKAFDFGIRIVELSNYMEEEKKRFPLTDRLLECASGIGVYVRLAAVQPKGRADNCSQAFRLSTEAEYLLELAVITDYLTQKQGAPLLTDCRSLKDALEKLSGRM